MPPKRSRQQLARQVNLTNQALTPEVIAKRTRRHLDELERSNYSEANVASISDDEGGDGGGSKHGRARQTISDKRTNLVIPGTSPAALRKKSTMNVRTALLYKKNLATLIDESGLVSLPANTPNYLTAVAPPPTYPPRMLCSVCSYWGTYKCKRCAMPYCDLNCEKVHIDTRCEKRVL
ncbi:hypothetical protein P691DRAFT_755521 [Macrolepiota fuliginosa MF-IS2]|uniref:HIT-type domain-containing protein n=1 Tax=Macrolepiota fuliginosa MF-IS2 TaxID=1400762 RepID=A0A9P5XMG7_9AGAR|nr:hypothetical protein P691DRAFT_755521 [Macrolepiota fuliginosa MF-IS2]